MNSAVVVSLCSLLAVSLFWLNGANAESVECVGVTIRPTEVSRLNKSINSHPFGTTFCFEPGRYDITSTIEAKDGDKFICNEPRRCIVDGAGKVSVGFRSAWAAKNRQIISGFTVQNFHESCMHIRAGGRAENNDLHDCDVGIAVDGEAFGNYIHHNRRYGISGGPANEIRIVGNEIAHNNTMHLDLNDDAGGSKIVGSRRGATVVWRNNKVHDNAGVGIWQDGNVTNTLIENNEVYNNLGSGILHELSWAAIIRSNIVFNNNLSQKGVARSCWHGGQIVVNNSQGVAIYANTVTAEGVNGICLVNSRRPEIAPFPTALANIKVRGNTVKMRGNVRTGIAFDIPPRDIRFETNTYYVTAVTGIFWQNRDDLTKAQWQTTGQDATSLFLVW